MGFYDEDEAFGEAPERKPSPVESEQPEMKRRRLNETVTWMGERENSTLEDALSTEAIDDDDDEEERDPEEVAARHDVLRRIGLKTKPTNALRRYLKKVAAGVGDSSL
ncbi:hypothetical protein TELCIR_17873 [Teladorsagia circumcincta]|uniref:Uncharacterized protein n=1 Tax=Teladorsagia circumcincta TaxID=45464 RepID=A0A2G9TRJ5_TELCI|nr:hypothetical protein TELCIR_17873 [Teladorsagia circumcincta]